MKTHTLKEEKKNLNRKSKKNIFFLQITKTQIELAKQTNEFPVAGDGGPSTTTSLSTHFLNRNNSANTSPNFFLKIKIGKNKKYRMREAMQKTQLLNARSEKPHCK